MDTIVCPKCGHFDKIEKVSAIIPHQRRTRTETEMRTEIYTDKDGKSYSSTYSVPHDVVEITDLAKQLELPPKPEMGTDRRGCFVAIALILSGIAFVMALFIIGTSNELHLNFAATLISIGLLSVIPLGLLGLLILLMIILYIGASSSHKQDILRVREEIPRWTHAVQRQDEAYYCYRDDIVFIPGKDNRYASLRQAKAFFYER
jgi:hypothetical protein